MLRKLIFSLVLASFSFLLIPRTYWHSCKTQHTNFSKTNKQEFDKKHESCSVCDFDLFQLSNPNQLLSISAFKEVFTFSETKVEFPSLKLISNWNKGPPSKILIL